MLVAGVCEAEDSGLSRRMGLDGQGMDAARDQRVKCIINEAMPGHTRQALETQADDAYREVPAFARAGMAGMQVAVILHLEQIGLQRGLQLAPDVVGGHAHGLVSFTGSGSR